MIKGNHVHKWKHLLTFKHFFGLIKSSYSKCNCGLIRHDNDGEIIDPKNLEFELRRR